MTYKIKVTKSFDKKLSNLPKLFNLTKEEAQEVLEEITFAMNELQKYGELPVEYADHVLERKPWIGYNEFHVLDDLLVVYFKVDKKKVIRMVTITNHEILGTGEMW